MKKFKGFKLLRRQKPVVYVNPAIKAYDILNGIKKKIDRHRVLICIQILMKKGKSEKALKIMREVVYNLFKDESERRSPLGGLYYIIDGIKRLEHVLFIMPIKKKGRVRYKKAKFLNQQKSISKAVQLLMKHAQQKVFETQQSYVKVLTTEFKELYTGLSQLYKKNDEVYQEIITLRYRRKYELLTSVYLAKYRKKKESYHRDPVKYKGDAEERERKEQQRRKIIRAKKYKKKIKSLKSVGYRARISKLVSYIDKNFKSWVIKKKKHLELVVHQQIRFKFVTKFKNHKWYFFMITLGKGSDILLFYNILNNIVKKKPLLKILIKFLGLEISKKFNKCLYLTKRSIIFLSKFLSLSLKGTEFQVDFWLKNNYAGSNVKQSLDNFNIAQWQVVYVKRGMYNILDYYYILMYKYQKHFVYKIQILKKTNLTYSTKKIAKIIFYKKKRNNLYKHKERGLKFPNTRLHSKEYLKSMLYMNEVQKKYFTKDMKDIVNSVSISLRDLKLKKLSILNTKE